MLVFVSYGNTLANGLFFDDEQFIYNNPYVKALDLPGLFKNSLSSESGEVTNYYRPLLFLGFSIEYQLFNNNGFIYHFDSFILHFIGSLLLFLFLKKLFRHQLISLLTSVLFLIHPIQTEAVAYASGRGDPLSFVFILLTLNLVLSNGKNKHLISYVTLIAALLSKEIALMSPGLIYLTILFSKKNLSRQTVIQSAFQTLPYAAITIIYFILRLTLLNFSNTLNFYNSANIYSSHLSVRLATFFNLFPAYLGLLIYPKTLFMERDSTIQIVTSLTLNAIVSILSLSAAVLMGMWKRKEMPIVLFSLLWIGISFIPTSGILPINGIFYEHFLYFPSVGFFLLFSFVAHLLYQRLPTFGKEAGGIVMIILIMVLSIRTINRNQEWRNPIVFYNQTLAHARSARAYNNLAMAYADVQDNNNAIAAYKKAIDISDTYPESHYNLANSYAAIHDLVNAEKEYKKALLIRPTFYLSYIKLYALYKESNNQAGLTFVKEGLTLLGKSNPQFILLLHQLENQ